MATFVQMWNGKKLRGPNFEAYHLTTDAKLELPAALPRASFCRENADDPLRNHEFFLDICRERVHGTYIADFAINHDRLMIFGLICQAFS